MDADSGPAPPSSFDAESADALRSQRAALLRARGGPSILERSFLRLIGGGWLADGGNESRTVQQLVMNRETSCQVKALQYP